MTSALSLIPSEEKLPFSFGSNRWTNAVGHSPAIGRPVPTRVLLFDAEALDEDEVEGDGEVSPWHA